MLVDFRPYYMTTGQWDLLTPNPKPQAPLQFNPVSLEKQVGTHATNNSTEDQLGLQIIAT
jgi:hypothetical protein